MDIFKYRAINRDGKVVKGIMEGLDQHDAVMKLKELKYTPLDITTGTILDNNVDFSFMQKVKHKDLAIFSKQFALLLDSGIAVLSALDILYRQTENKKLRNVINSMQEDVQKGNSLNASMRKQKDIFPEIMLNIIEAGETTGNLEDSFEKMSVHFEKEAALNGKLKGSMVYACVLLSISAIVITILITMVVPNFVSIYATSGFELPITTKILLKVSGFITTFWYLILLGIIAIIVGFKFYKKTESGILFIDKFKISIPAIGDLNKKIIVARFSRTLSSLIGSGLPLFSSLEVVSRILGNRIYQKAIEKIRSDVGNGLTLTQALTETDLFMKMVVQMVKVGEDTGRLEITLSKISDFYDEEIIEATDKVASLMEPALMIFLGTIIGFIILSIVQPMFGMLDSINSIK